MVLPSTIISEWDSHIEFTLGLCTITIDMGPTPNPQPISLILQPDAFRTLAAAVLSKCVIDSEHIGGFITDNIENFVHG